MHVLICFGNAFNVDLKQAFFETCTDNTLMMHSAHDVEYIISS